MKEITNELLSQFRAPEFPGSFFISFEGIEGAGKSTQIVRLKNFLEEKSFRVIILREPGGTAYGEKLRSVILQTTTEIAPLAEAHLFASSRAQLLLEVTLKELAVPNTVVIYDRYIDSSLTYQGHARGLGMHAIMSIHSTFPLTLVPHLSFYLRIDEKTSEKRQQMRNAPKDYFESKGISFYKKLIEGYDTLLELFPHRIIKIDASRPENEIAQSITDIVLKLVTKMDQHD